MYSLIKKTFYLLSTLFFAHSVYAADFAMTTTGFLDGSAIPTLYTCDGKDISPQFAWTNPPANTQSFTMIMSNPDAPGGTWYHWVVFNIPSKTAEIAEAADKIPGAVMGRNSWNKLVYNGPCPPKGTSHRYIFTLYALNTKLKTPVGADALMVMDAMQKHILKQVTQTAVYSRWLK